MLGKLLKYDLKSLGKLLIPLYIILILLGSLCRVFDYLKEINGVFNFIHVPLLIFFIVGIIGICMGTFILTIRRFYQNLVQDNGYLTHTLPVSKRSIVLAKILSGVLCMIFTIMVVILVVVIVFYDKDALNHFLAEFDLMIREVFYQPGWLFLVYIALFVLISYLTQLMMIYFAIALGQTQNTNKLIFSFVFWFVLYIVYELLALIGLGVNILINPSIINQLNQDIPDAMIFIPFFITAVITQIIFIIGTTIGTIKVFEKKLNLE